MSNIQQAKIDFENMLLESAEYSGNKLPEQKIFSASMLGNDMLQIYLKYFNGTTSQKQYGMNTLGSVYQLGADVAADNWNERHYSQKKPQYQQALRLTYKLSNGWTISGEMDHIDWINNVIVDNKVVTETSVLKVKSEGKDNGYALQMGVYQFLLYNHMKTTFKIPEPEIFKVLLPMINKGHSLYKKINKTNILNMIEPETYSLADIEQLLIDKTNLLQEYIDLNEFPPECENLWWFGFGAAPKKKMRCLHYCDQSKFCPNLTDHNVMTNLLDQL